MDENERNELAWRGFQLGMLLALQAHGIKSIGQDQDKVIQLLGEVARGETTTSDPTKTAAGYMKDTAGVIVSIGNAAIRANREVAQWAVAGLDRAADTSDD